jgi:hypothetical protein
MHVVNGGAGCIAGGAMHAKQIGCALTAAGSLM